MALTEKYGKFQIAYNEHTDTWTGILDGKTVATSAKLSDLKKRLDKHERAEKAFTRVKVIWKDHWQGWREGEVTSVTPDGEAWVTEDGEKKSRLKRGKYDLTGTYLHTPDNMKRREEWDALEERIKSLEKQQETILKTMERFIPPKVAE